MQHKKGVALDGFFLYLPALEYFKSGKRILKMAFYDSALHLDTIVPELKVANQKQAFQVLCEYASRATGLDQKRLLGRLLAWERKTASSGIGNGVAIPHLVMDEIDKPYMLFARASQKIVYDALDGEPVDLVFMILSPRADGPLHLQRLARISRMLRDQNLCNRLRGADTTDAIHALLFDQTSRRMAA